MVNRENRKTCQVRNGRGFNEKGGLNNGQYGSENTVFGGKREILATTNGLVDSVQVQISDEGISRDEHGRKIMLAGTIIGGVGGSVHKDETRLVARHGYGKLRTAFPGNDNDFEIWSLTNVNHSISFMRSGAGLKFNDTLFFCVQLL